MTMRKWVIPAVSALFVVAVGCGDAARESAPPSSPPTLTAEQVLELGRNNTFQLYGKGIWDQTTLSATGVLVSTSKRLVVTSAVFVLGRSSIMARMSGSEETTSAKVIASAPCEEVAVVQLDTLPAGARSATLGTGSFVRTGEPVTVIGYPPDRSADPTTQIAATNGAAEAPKIENADVGSVSPRFSEVIQHSARSPSDTVGAPLFNNRAELIGVNTNADRSGGTVNHFYSIGIDRVNKLLPQLETGKSEARAGWLLWPVAEFQYESYFGDPAVARKARRAIAAGAASGVYVFHVEPGSPAATAIRSDGTIQPVVEGDAISYIKGQKVENVADVCAVLMSTSPGETVRVDGKYFLESPGPDLPERPERPMGTDWSVYMKLP